jgi:hypothetical protein
LSPDYWEKADVMPLVGLILFFSTFVMNDLLLIVIYVQGRTLNIFSFILSIIIVPFLILSWRKYKQRKNMVMIRAMQDTNKWIHLIEITLQQNNIRYNRLLNKSISTSYNPFSYAEIFKLSDYDLLIRISQPRSNWSIVELGPQNNTDVSHFQNLKRILQYAFYPQLHFNQ